MKRFIFLIPIVVALLVLTGIVAAQDSPATRAQAAASTADVAAPSVGSIETTTFTYQGLIKKSGSPINDNCDLAFRLFDAASIGAPIGSPITRTTVPITNGLFTVGLNFGDGSVYAAEARWLEIRVQCPAGSGGFTTLNPRQALTPAPLALALPGLRTEPHAISPNVIGGYRGNTIITGVVGAVIGGGGYSGHANSIGGSYSVIAGGNNNTLSNDDSFIGGGNDNQVNGNLSVIGGGKGNSVDGVEAAVFAGRNNTAGGDDSFIGGGANNNAANSYSIVSGGASNNASNTYANVSGGDFNTASGNNATVPGGHGNVAQGTDSFAAGYNARALDDGAFVWADDSVGVPISSTAENQFLIRASGGVSLAINANYAKIINVGERYRDNAIVAWAKIDGVLGVVQNAQTASFGIAATRRIAAGQYGITTTASASINFNLVPIAIAEIDSAPSGAANVRIVSVNQINPNYFEVYINDGNFVLVDNDFTVMVTGR